MKNIIFLIVFASIGILGCRVSDIRNVSVKIPTLVDQTAVTKVQAALAPLPGIIRDKTVFDLKARVVIVCYDSMTIAHKNIEIAIAEAGFDANEISACPKK